MAAVNPDNGLSNHLVNIHENAGNLHSKNLSYSDTSPETLSNGTDSQWFDQLSEPSDTQIQPDDLSNKQYSAIESEPGQQKEEPVLVDKQLSTVFLSSSHGVLDGVSTQNISNFTSVSAKVISSPITPLSSSLAQHAEPPGKMLTVPSVVGVLSTSLSGALNSSSVLRFVVAIPGLSDINVAASITSNGLSGVSLRTQDHRLRDWLSDNQRDIEIGLKLETGKTVEIEVREDNSGATELSRGGA